MPTEPKINYVDQSEQVSEQPQKREASPEPEEPNRAKARRVLDFDVVSPPTSPNPEMSLPPTPRGPFRQDTTPDNANDPCESQPNSPVIPSSTHEGPPPTPCNAFKGGSPMEARSPVHQQEVQLYEGDFIELQAKGQDTEFPEVTSPPTKRESDLKKELETLQEKVKK